MQKERFRNAHKWLWPQLCWCKMSPSPSPFLHQLAFSPCSSAGGAHIWELPSSFHEKSVRLISAVLISPRILPQPDACRFKLFLSHSSREGCATSAFWKWWALETVTYLKSPARRVSRCLCIVSKILFSTSRLGNKLNLYNTSTISYPDISSAS